MSLADIYRGDTKRYALTFKDAAGQPIELFGKKLYFTMKSDITLADADAELQVTLTFPAGPESTAGTGILQLAASETEVLDPGTYFYDFQLVEMVPDPDPDIVTTVGAGKVKVLADVTRSVA